MTSQTTTFRGREITASDPFELLEQLTEDDHTYIEMQTGRCANCYILGAIACTHVTDRKSRTRSVEQMRIQPHAHLYHVSALVLAGFHVPTHFSPIEARLLDAFVAANIVPDLQYRIGPYYADFAFPSIHLVVEADGKQYHQDVEREQRRDAYIQSLGWRVRHYTGRQIHRETDRIVQTIQRELGAAA